MKKYEIVAAAKSESQVGTRAVDINSNIYINF